MPTKEYTANFVRRAFLTGVGAIVGFILWVGVFAIERALGLGHEGAIPALLKLAVFLAPCVVAWRYADKEEAQKAELARRQQAGPRDGAVPS